MLLHCRRVCVSDTMVNVADVAHFRWVALFCVASSEQHMVVCCRGRDREGAQCMLMLLCMLPCRVCGGLNAAQGATVFNRTAYSRLLSSMPIIWPICGPVARAVESPWLSMCRCGARQAGAAHRGRVARGLHPAHAERVRGRPVGSGRGGAGARVPELRTAHSGARLVQSFSICLCRPQVARLPIFNATGL